MSETSPFAAGSSAPSTSNANSSRVAYFYDADVGNYVYYLGHPMKPHRIRMAHNLIVNYGLCDEEETAESDGSRRTNDPIHGVNGAIGSGAGDWRQDGADERFEKALASGARGKAMQVFRARRAGKDDMTRFHTDEYVELLEQVNPDNGESLTGGGMRCESGSVKEVITGR